MLASAGWLELVGVPAVRATWDALL